MASLFVKQARSQALQQQPARTLAAQHVSKVNSNRKVANHLAKQRRVASQERSLKRNQHQVLIGCARRARKTKRSNQMQCKLNVMC